MSKNIIVLGLGRFGSALASNLYNKGLYVTAIDKDMAKVEKIANLVSSAVACDMTEEVAMNSLGISNYDVAIIATGSDLESSIEATLICKDSGVEKVIAKASSMTHARILKKIGADKIVYPEFDTAESLSRQLSGSNILENIQLSDEFSIIELKARKKWVGKSLLDLDFRNKYQMNVIAYKKNGTIDMDVDPNRIIEDGDILVLIGSSDNARFIEEVE